MPDKVVISDTSCLIILNNINELGLLKKIFGSVTITDIVADEFGDQLPEWIIVKKAPEAITKALAEFVDYGEASTIALTLETINKNQCLLILDDLRARKYAQRIGLTILGTIGIIAKAKKEGIIKKGMDIMGKIQKTNFRLSAKIINEIKKELKE